MRRSLLGLTLFFLAAAAVPAVTLAPRVAHAQTAEARTRARAAYTEGQRLFDASDFAGALAKFEEAYSIVNNPVVLLGVASAQERLGRLPEARATLERYLRERPDATDRADVERRIAALPAAAPAATTGTVTVTSEPPGAVVVVDGESSGATTPTELTLPPGDHEIALALSGYELATETVSVTAGGTHTVASSLTALPEPEPMDEDAAFGEEGEGEGEGAGGEETPAASTDPSAATWVMTAVAGVALVTGTVFGFLALSRQSDFDVMPSRTLADEGEAFALAADLSFGVAVAAGITAIVLYAVDRPSAPAEAAAEPESETEEGTEPAEGEATASVDLSVMPIVGPTGGGAAMSLSF